MQENKERAAGNDGHQMHWHKQGPLPPSLLTATWHMPSRCFVDAGFRTLDPFGSGVSQEDLAEPLLRSHRAEISPLGGHMQTVANSETVQIQQRGTWKFAEGNDIGPLSLCCQRETRNGAYHATRVEGLDERVNGRIVDSFCRSSL